MRLVSVAEHRVNTRMVRLLVTMEKARAGCFSARDVHRACRQIKEYKLSDADEYDSVSAMHRAAHPAAFVDLRVCAAPF